MGDLSKNLSRHEFACNCGCNFDTVDSLLVEFLQASADYFSLAYDASATIIITGGNRCREHNDKLREECLISGGIRGANTSRNSQHIHGRAADHKIFLGNGKQVPEREVYAFYAREYGEEVSLGRYDGRTHMDTRTNGGKRWDLRSVKD